MKYRALLIAGMVLAPVTAWTVSKEFNGANWLAQVPAPPSTSDGAYAQWTDDGQGGLTPGPGFKAVLDGINAQFADMAQTAMANSPSVDQQKQTAINLAQKYNTPEGRAALAAMTPAQLVALSQQMGGGGAGMDAPRVVSPAEQAFSQKFGNGVYSGRAQVDADAARAMTPIAGLETKWDADVAKINTQEGVQLQQLPPCPGEAGAASGQATAALKQQFAQQRATTAAGYLGQMAPLLEQLHAALMPEISFGDDAMYAAAQVQNADARSHVTATAQTAEKMSLGDVGRYAQAIEDISRKAAQPAADKQKIAKAYANAGGC